MKSDRLIRHSIPLHAANLLVLALNALYQRLMGGVLSPEEFGVLQALNSGVALLILPFSVISSGLTHFMSRSLSEGRPAEVRALLEHWMFRMAVLGAGVVAVGWGFSGAISAYLHFHRAEPVIVTAAFVLVSMLSGVVAAPQAALQAFTWISAGMILFSVGRLALGLLLTRLAFPTAGWALAGSVLALLASALLGMFSLRGLLPAGRDPAARADAPVVRYVGWSIPFLMAYLVLFSADTLVIKRLFPAREAGYYSQFALLARLAVFLPLPFCRALFPKVASGGTVTRGQRRTWVKAVAATLALMAPVGGALLLFPGLVCGLIFPGAPLTPEWRGLLAVLVLATVANGLLHLLLTFETAQHRFHTLWPCLFGALAYLAMVPWFSDTLRSATVLFAACNAVACLGTLAGAARFLWHRPLHPSPA